MVKTIGEHKQLNDENIRFLKVVLNERDRFHKLRHNRSKEIIGYRAKKQIEVLNVKDKNNENSFNRKISLYD